MCSLLHRLAVTVWVLIIPILLCGVVWAQGSQPVPEPAPSQDAFAGWRASLSDAADRALAASLADKPWMKMQMQTKTKTPDPAAAGTAGLSSITVPEPVLRIRAAIQRVQQLRPIIEPILRQGGVPTELSAIVLVESGGQLTALSSKGARGVWQFMPDTARRYGLTVSTERDERLDVNKSTRAAAHYLRDLYQQFGDWQLAFAAYNAGEQAVQRAASRSGQRDFFSLQRVLPQETRNYVPAVLSAMSILGSSPEGVLRTVSSSRPPRGRLLYASADAKE